MTGVQTCALPISPFLLMRNGGVLFTSSFMFSYKTIRHRSVESSCWSPSRWSSIFFLMIRMFWASIACSIVMSFNYIFPQIARPPHWFSYQNFSPYIKMELPPDLHDNSRWLGFTVYALYTIEKQGDAFSYEQDSTNSTILLRFSSLSHRKG